MESGPVSGLCFRSLLHPGVDREKACGALARTGSFIPAGYCVRVSTAPDERNDGYAHWLEHFRSNARRHELLDRQWNWSASAQLTPAGRAAFVHSLQRFEVGENGAGARLLARAERAGDATYLDCLRLFVAEEQRHSALFGRMLDRFGAEHLRAHWSDAAFTLLRRALGLRTELVLFLIAEAIALEYFTALADGAPDAELRRLGAYVLEDERNHVRFQIARLREGFGGTPTPLRFATAALWGLVALGTTIVVCLDHGSALRSCGRRPLDVLRACGRNVRGSIRAVLGGGSRTDLRPGAPLPLPVFPRAA